MAPGLRVPEPFKLVANSLRYSGDCPSPGHRTLDAGTVSVQGPNFGPIPAEVITEKRLLVYRASLPEGTMRPGEFRVSASGGKDVGAFESNVRIGSGIMLDSEFPPGSRLDGRQPFRVTWTGGDDSSWVRMLLVTARWGLQETYYYVHAVRASSGKLELPGGAWLRVPIVPTDLVFEVVPDESQETVVTGRGLSLGGRHSWKYTYRFKDLIPFW